jgi:ribosomal protein S18 acetylase RimI-like enzyme
VSARGDTAIRDPRADDEPAWRRLWDGYNRFYGTTVPAEVTAATWRRILDPVAPVFARLAARDAEVVGFAICIVHAGTWSIAPMCYLEDLFVAETARGRGIGRLLMEDAIVHARREGFARFYWHTRADNVAARRLYDRFTRADGFVRYRMVL